MFSFSPQVVVDMRIMFIAIGAVFIHFMADFVFNFESVKTKMDNSHEHLVLHCLVYSIIIINYFGVSSLVFLDFEDFTSSMFLSLVIYQIVCSGVNIVVHAIVDIFFLSRRSRAFKDGRMEDFWAMVGVDQAIHCTVLLGTIFFYTQFLIKISN